MKKSLKTFSAFFLSLLIVFSSCTFLVSASSGAAPSVERSTSIPTVYIQGYGAEIFADAYDRNSEVIVGGDVPFIADGVIGDLLESLIEPLMKGVTTGDYTEYNEIMTNTLVDALGRYALDENGEPSDGSGNFCNREKTLYNKNWYSGKYDIYSYCLTYDWRVDPFVTAAELNDYIKMVKAVTGAPRVNLVGRCLGANIVLTYLAEYGYDDVNAVNFYVAGIDGFDVVGALFSGQVEVDSDALDRFIQANLTGDDELLSFAKSLVAILNFINGLDLPIEVVYGIYEQVYKNILPAVLKETFGTMPAFWSFVGTEYYDAAIELNFSDDADKIKYAKLIEKIERYHNEVSLKTEEIINNAIAEDVSVYFTAKYGAPAMPLSKESKYHCDGTVSVASQSYGATSSVQGRTFANSYLDDAEANGTAKYISPDKCIDASTAIRPDNSWFIKGSLHANMPNSVDIMMARIFEATGAREKYVTVNDFEEYPQYLFVETDEEYAPLIVMTEENATVGQEWDKSIFDHLLNFFDKLFNFITDLVEQLREMIESAISTAKE